MKRISSNNPPHPHSDHPHSEDPSQDPSQGSSKDPLDRDDPLWNLLGNASEHEANPFFARNIVRQTRRLDHTHASWLEHVTSFFTSKKAILPLAAAACIGVLAVTQTNTEQPVTPEATTTAQVDPLDDPSSDLAELILEESLVAAAEDPSQFTHDEVVAMVGL